MDRFTKNALLIMTGLVLTMCISTYVGAVVFKGDMETKYIRVMEDEANSANLNLMHLVEFDETGEYVTFTIAGAIGGFVVGFCWSKVFETCKEG